ncbi:MAG: PIN domain-containing protein, partial [Lachnospiraceae bacterium]|nr:PIN domain-containing protein [Lachnospiraceae bacterium]
MKILVDTNIIIDALTGREPFRESAEQIFMLAANQLQDMYITAGSATDIYYLIKKHLHNTEQSKNTMSKLYQLFGILDVTANDCQDALLSNMNDYED